MKKVLMILVASIALALSFSVTRVSAETVTYSPTYITDHGYNLDTGAYIASSLWDCTSKVLLVSDNLTLSATTAHHLLFWDDANIYLGYFNVDPSSDYQGSMWLGDYSAPFTVPTGADRFALVVQKAGVSEIAVSGNSYASIFASPVYLGFETEYLNGATPYTLDDIFTPAITTVTNIGYSRTSLGNHAPEFGTEGVTVLSLTNLIQNGQFVGNLNNWTTNSQITYNSESDIVIVNTSAPLNFQSATFDNQSAGNIYVNIYGYDTSQCISMLYLLDGVLNPQSALTFDLSSSLNIYSNIYTLQGGYDKFSIVRTVANQYAYIKDISVFNSGSYTKTQIDTALSYTGYLTYNLLYEIPDTDDADFTTGSGFGANTVAYLVRGSGLESGLELIDYEYWFHDVEIDPGTELHAGIDLTGWDGDEWTLFDLWRATYADPADRSGYWDTISGIDGSSLPGVVQTDFYADTVARDYYVDLYFDAVAETPDRWEWYDWAGVTSTNYATILARFNFLTANYSVTYDIDDLNDITLSSTRADEEPVVTEDVIPWFEGWLTDTIGLGAFGDFPYILFSILGIVVVVVVLALLHAPGIIVLAFALLATMLFVVFGWLPFWIAIIIIIGIIAFLLFIKPGGTA